MNSPEFPGSASSLHTHPSVGGKQGDPSDADIADAKKTHRTYFVASKSGLWSVDPAGQVTHVFTSPSWFTEKQSK